jgi:uncharacterized membrane protein YphA (DoxX/SURF4 family)
MMIIRVLLAMGLGSVFLTSAVPKMRHPKNFMLAVIEYRILPFTLSRLFALILPALELLIALLLVTGTFVRFAALAYAFLMLSFVIGVSVNIRRGRDLRCHCFGSNHKRTITASLVMQDLLLCMSAFLLAVLTPSWWVSEQWSFMRYVGLAPFAALLLLGTFSVILSMVLGSTKVISSRAKLIHSSQKLVPIRARASHQGDLR